MTSTSLIAISRLVFAASACRRWPRDAIVQQPMRSLANMPQRGAISG